MSGDLLVLAVGQARQMGRMFNVWLDDGLLDFTLLFGSPGKQVRVFHVYACIQASTAP
jgi:hypothetical protein